jgi:hypothetical protein
VVKCRLILVNEKTYVPHDIVPTAGYFDKLSTAQRPTFSAEKVGKPAYLASQLGRQESLFAKGDFSSGQGPSLNPGSTPVENAFLWQLIICADGQCLRIAVFIEHDSLRASHSRTFLGCDQYLCLRTNKNMVYTNKSRDRKLVDSSP